MLVSFKKQVIAKILNFISDLDFFIDKLACIAQEMIFHA